jgi:hypothetical protein
MDLLSSQAMHCSRVFPGGLQHKGGPSHATLIVSLAEKKMMSSASASGSQQIYSQGSPFPAGHSGKAFR